MTLMETLASQKDRELLAHAMGADLLHGCLDVRQVGDGWVRPERFLPRQRRVLESCMAWHPGLYLRMAEATSGVCLRFRTDASEVALAVRVDAQSRWVRERLREAEGTSSPGPHDGVSCDVDGRHLGCAEPHRLEEGLPGMPGLAGASVYAFSLEEPDEAPQEGLQLLPGFGPMREVTLWLPCLSGCEVGDLWCNGMTIEAVEVAGTLLVLGDGATQGLVTGDPGLTWPAQLAKRWELDLIDQGIAGQVFQAGTCPPLAGHVRPQRIVVAYGNAYRHEACAGVHAQREAANFLDEVARVWPNVPCQVITPTWHNEDRLVTHRHSCFNDVPHLIRRAAASHGGMYVTDGLTLLDHRPDLLADADHPTAEGARQLAQRAYVAARVRETPRELLPPRAQEVLEGTPMRAFPLRECLRRGIGRVLLAEPGCTILRVPDGNQYVYAPDREMGRAAVALLLEPTLVTVCEPEFERDVRQILGLDLVEPYHLVVYEGGRSLRVAKRRAAHIRPLDVSYAKTVHERYSFAQFVSEDEVRRRLAEGLILGAFEGDELVGFVGEHPEGSIGMLEVFQGHRGKGWGEALLSVKANRMLERGWTPWTEVYPYNKVSLKMQEKLGFTVYPASDQCFVSRKA